MDAHAFAPARIRGRCDFYGFLVKGSRGSVYDCRLTPIKAKPIVRFEIAGSHGQQRSAHGAKRIAQSDNTREQGTK